MTSTTLNSDDSAAKDQNNPKDTKAADVAKNTGGASTDTTNKKPAPLPVQMPQPESAKVRVLSDRVLCATLTPAETRSRGGILIPATAESMTKHGMWCTVEEIGPMVRSVNIGEKVLFLMDEAIQVDISGTSHFIVRERDLHAAAAPQGEDTDDQGLYL